MPLDVSFEINEGSLTAIEGPSGSGKTTILRLISGLIKPERGRIKVNGELWFDDSAEIDLAPQKRKVGFVFQDHALFPNMTVKENIEFAFEGKKDEKFVDELLETTGLRELKDRYPSTLSGGQKQRASLARAIVRKPKILLLDEPLSALDAEMRTTLQDFILEVHRKFNLTTILVSHDVSEIFKMSDKIIRLSQGKISASGSPDEILGGKYISGKFKFTGEVLSIEKNEVINIFKVLVGNNIIKIIATDEEKNGIKPGDKVIIASKAFNPIIIKI